jgi:release factor glutamine methyltransferase
MPGKDFSYKDLQFALDPNVINPHFGSLLISEHLPRYIDKGDIVLDLGTGIGILGIIAAKKAKTVFASDISVESVRLAKKNAETNGVGKKFFAFAGDMFENLKTNRFDLIIGNIPMMPALPANQKDPLSHAKDGGPDGRHFLDKMIKEAPDYLKDRGKLLFQQFDFLCVRTTLTKMEEKGFTAKIIDARVHALGPTGRERLEYLRSLGIDSLIHEKRALPLCKRYAVLGIKK